MLRKYPFNQRFISFNSLLVFSLVNIFAFTTASAAVLEEVVVTAQKRSESIQDIAIAITALSQDSLDRSGIDSLEEYAYKVPGLAISGQGNGRQQLNIRGISSGEIRRDNTRASETVGIYFDEIPLSTALYNPDLEPFDLERVEVLRGPQGTLYGSGSLAGTIRLVSKAPVMNEFEGSIDTGFDSVDDGDLGYSVKGALNVPMVDDVLAARVVAYHKEEGGWIDNLAPSPGGGEDVNDTQKTGIRAAFLWTPSARLTIKPTYIYQKSGADGTPADNVEAVGVARLVTVGTLTANQAFDPSDEYEQWKFNDQSYDDELHIGNLHINYDFENVQLTSSSTYTTRDVQVIANISDNNLGGGFFPAPPSPTGGSVNVLGIVLEDGKEINSFSQEVRLTSTHEGDFQWIAGAYFNDIKVDYTQPLRVTDPRGIVGVPPSANVQALYSNFNETPGVLLRTVDKLNVDQIAAFGEASYRFADRFQATVGLRWFDVEQTYSSNLTGRLSSGRGFFTRTTKEDGFNPKFLLSYEATEDILLSAQASKGFRLGGPQNEVPTVATVPGVIDCPADIAALGASFDPNGFDSETLWNYELGIKSAWNDNTLLFNAAAFFIDYTDLQVTTRLNCGTSFTTNAGGAESKGIEFEIQALVRDDLSLSFGGSYTDTELTDDLLSGEALKGDELIYVPNLKFNASMAYTRPLSDTLTGYLNLSYQYTGTVDMFYQNAGNVPVTRSREADAYQTANLRIGMEAERWEVALYVNNLWNEFATTYIDSINSGGPGGWVTDTTIRPRTIGLNAKYRF